MFTIQLLGFVPYQDALPGMQRLDFFVSLRLWPVMASEGMAKFVLGASFGPFAAAGGLWVLATLM